MSRKRLYLYQDFHYQLFLYKMFHDDVCNWLVTPLSKMWLWVSRSLTSLRQKLLFFFFFGGGGGGGGGGVVCMYSQCLAQFSDFLLEAPPFGNAFYNYFVFFRCSVSKSPFKANKQYANQGSQGRWNSVSNASPFTSTWMKWMTINSPRRELLLPGTFIARPKSTSRYLNQIKINQSVKERMRNLTALSGKGQSGMS